MSEQHHDRTSPVASAYFSASTTLEMIGMDLDAIGSLGLLVATSERLDRDAQEAFRAIVLAVQHVRERVRKEERCFDRLSQSRRPAPVAA